MLHFFETSSLILLRKLYDIKQCYTIKFFASYYTNCMRNTSFTFLTYMLCIIFEMMLHKLRILTDSNILMQTYPTRSFGQVLCGSYITCHCYNFSITNSKLFFTTLHNDYMQDTSALLNNNRNVNLI